MDENRRLNKRLQNMQNLAQVSSNGNNGVSGPNAISGKFNRIVNTVSSNTVAKNSTIKNSMHSVASGSNLSESKKEYIANLNAQARNTQAQNTQARNTENNQPVPNIKQGTSNHSITSIVNINSQTKTFAAGGFTLVFALILILFAIRPTFTDIVRIRHQLKVYQDIALKLDDKIDTIYNLSNTFDKNKTTLAYFDIYYPRNLDYSLFVANLEYIAKDLGTKLIGVSYSEQTGQRYTKNFEKRGINAVVPVVFSITIQGDYNQLVAFLKRIEQTPFLPEVLSMSYQASTPEKEQSFTINVLLFRVKTPITKTNKDIYGYITGIQ